MHQKVLGNQAFGVPFRVSAARPRPVGSTGAWPDAARAAGWGVVGAFGARTWGTFGDVGPAPAAPLLAAGVVAGCWVAGGIAAGA